MDILTIASYASMGVTAAAAAMAVLPQGKPGSWWDKTRTAVNFLAFNFGNAKNITQNK